MSPDGPPRCIRCRQPHLPKQPGEGASYPWLEIIAKLATAVAVDSRDTTEPMSGLPVRPCIGHWRDGLLEHQSATCPRLRDLEPALGRRWVVDPRPPAFLLQAPVCLRPGWEFVGFLNPMD